MNPKKIFNEQAPGYVEALKEITKSKDSNLDESLRKQIKDWLSINPQPSPTQVWNFYKEILDLSVRYALVSNFYLTLFNLESYYLPPEGGYNQKDGTILKAPWRLRIEKEEVL